MYWHDYKTEKPESGTLCLTEFKSENPDLRFKLAYFFDDGSSTIWKLIGVNGVDDGRDLIRWMPINERQQPFKERVENESESFRDRLAVEYHQLSIRIEKLEKALIMLDILDDEQKELLLEQRKAMLAYKDVLFRRCYLNKVDLYKLSFNCKPAPEGKL